MYSTFNGFKGTKQIKDFKHKRSVTKHSRSQNYIETVIAGQNKLGYRIEHVDNTDDTIRWNNDQIMIHKMWLQIQELFSGQILVAEECEESTAEQ